MIYQLAHEASAEGAFTWVAATPWVIPFILGLLAGLFIAVKN